MKTRIYDKKFTRIQALHSTRALTRKKSHLPFASAGSFRFAPSKALYGAVLAAFIAVLVLVYRTRGLSFRWDLFGSALRHADWRWLVASILLALLTVIGRALRWQVMLRPFGRSISFWKLTSDTAVGLAAGVILGRAGEVIRPYLIAKDTGLPFASQAAAWLIERLLDMSAVFIICAYALLRVPIPPAGGYSLGLAAILILILLLAFADPAQRAQKRILAALAFLPETARERVGRLLGTFADGVRSIGDTQSLILLLLYTCFAWTIILSGSYTTLHAFSATAGIGASDVVILVAFATLGSTVQVPGLGGGMQAAVILGLTKIYRLPVETAAGIALALWLIGSITIVLFGLLCAFHQGLNWGKLKLLSTKQILEPEA
jgi:glycosyltransferase 2 family protein